ncbi:hypothetical protein JRQ81_011588 [Phrynocephalus forsythii]|uniref:Uncharacterized protein n=1 Tax=Phrynocephalus forsythii TaxID=171643 RepID=A0A9Q0X649_9SAUR|nr:hypothetical protein JRQ81_011588 [Phrynocephalus forsythii]
MHSSSHPVLTLPRQEGPQRSSDPSRCPCRRPTLLRPRGHQDHSAPLAGRATEMAFSQDLERQQKATPYHIREDTGQAIGAGSLAEPAEPCAEGRLLLQGFAEGTRRSLELSADGTHCQKRS